MYFHLLPVPFLGMALLWSSRLVFGRHQATRDDPIVLVLSISAWVLIYMGIGLVVGPVLFMVGLVIGGMVVARYRYAERRTLLWILAIAAERGIPLAKAARSYANGRIDEMGCRATNLAENLEMGVPLPAALDRSRSTLPRDGELAARIGYATDTLATTLREAALDQDQVSASSHAAYGTLLYFMTVVNVMLAILAFVCVQVLPSYRVIMQDFDVELPAVTEMFIQFWLMLANYWWILTPLIVLALVLMVYALIAYLGFRVPDFPVVGRLLRRYDTAVILRSIGSGIAQGRPIDQSIDLLAHWYPVNYVGAKLALTSQKMKAGANWCDSLVETRLMRPADAAVLKAAQRVGNLEWACHELAETLGRRARYQATSIARFTLPLLAIVIGIPVAFFAVAMILPLSQLIEALTG